MDANQAQQQLYQQQLYQQQLAQQAQNVQAQQLAQQQLYQQAQNVQAQQLQQQQAQMQQQQLAQAQAGQVPPQPQAPQTMQVQPQQVGQPQQSFVAQGQVTVPQAQNVQPQQVGQPVPIPVPQPMSVPTPVPMPDPTPMSVPTPVPMPDPMQISVPTPMAVPIPVPQEQTQLQSFIPQQTFGQAPTGQDFQPPQPAVPPTPQTFGQPQSFQPQTLGQVSAPPEVSWTFSQPIVPPTPVTFVQPANMTFVNTTPQAFEQTPSTQGSTSVVGQSFFQEANPGPTDANTSTFTGLQSNNGTTTGPSSGPGAGAIVVKRAPKKNTLPMLDWKDFFSEEYEVIDPATGLAKIDLTSGKPFLNDEGKPIIDEETGQPKIDPSTYRVVKERKPIDFNNSLRNIVVKKEPEVKTVKGKASQSYTALQLAYNRMTIMKTLVPSNFSYQFPYMRSGGLWYNIDEFGKGSWSIKLIIDRSNPEHVQHEDMLNAMRIHVAKNILESRKHSMGCSNLLTNRGDDLIKATGFSEMTAYPKVAKNSNDRDMTRPCYYPKLMDFPGNKTAFIDPSTRENVPWERIQKRTMEGLAYLNFSLITNTTKGITWKPTMISYIIMKIGVVEKDDAQQDEIESMENRGYNFQEVGALLASLPPPAPADAKPQIVIENNGQPGQPNVLGQQPGNNFGQPGQATGFNPQGNGFGQPAGFNPQPNGFGQPQGGVQQGGIQQNNGYPQQGGNFGQPQGGIQQNTGYPQMPNNNFGQPVSNFGQPAGNFNQQTYTNTSNPAITVPVASAPNIPQSHLPIFPQ